MEHALTQLVEALCYEAEGHGFDSRWGTLGFFVDLILPESTKPIPDEYQEHFLGVRAADA